MSHNLMSHNSIRSSPADIAANIAAVLLTAVVAVLLCIYFLKQNGLIDAPSDGEIPHVIGMEHTDEASAATETVTESVSQTETSVVSVTEPAQTVVTGDFTPEFFENVFIIGDSLSIGFVNYEYLKPENVFAQVAITPSSVMTTEIDGVSVYEKASDFDPEYICIMLGTNGLSYLKGSYMAEKMSVFIDELEKICPEAQIVLVSIPPVTEKHESEKPENVELIVRYNEHIKKLAAERSLVYADTFPQLCDENGYLASDYAETDGLHLKIHAYPVILSTIQSAVENNTIPSLDDISEELLVDIESETDGSESTTSQTEITSVTQS
ncbi:MAG: GDSL-type esterase/lipase family protein [Oscillospiraceae bacterium]